MNRVSNIVSGALSEGPHHCLVNTEHLVYCHDMAQKLTLTIRVDGTDLEKWRKASGGNLSGWIRDTLNARLGHDSSERAMGMAAGVSGERGARVSRGSVGCEDRGLGDGESAGSVQDSFGKPPITMPRTNVCVNCEHAKHKHGGFGNSCQFEGCLCATYE